MAVAEQIPNSELLEQMPTPGSYQHLEWIAQLDPAHVVTHDQVDDFLSETNVSRTLGLFTKRLRVFRPIRTETVEIDSRMFKGQESWIPLLRSSYTRNPANPDLGLLTVHGQPQPWELGEENYTYDVALPINFDFTYDPSRPAQATVRTDVQGQRPHHAVYNQAAFPEYREDNPAILFAALRMAAHDMAAYARFAYGVDAEPAYISEDERVTKIDRVAQSIVHLLK